MHCQLIKKEVEPKLHDIGKSVDPKQVEFTMADVKGIDRATVKLKENITKKFKDTGNIESST